MRRRPPTIYIVLALVGLAGFFAADQTLPKQHLPWRSLNPDAPVGFATDLQLFRVALSPSSTCSQLVAETQNMHAVSADPHRPKNPCGWDKAQVMEGRHTIALAPGDASMQCPLALGTYIWLGEIDQAAQKHLGSSLSRVHHAGAYSCRRQVGNDSGAWSEHAFANAWDITGFELQDGRIISVLNDWDGEKDRKNFLREVRSKACKIFRVTLSPDYNAAHKDHFHVDMGPTVSCR